MCVPKHSVLGYIDACCTKGGVNVDDPFYDLLTEHPKPEKGVQSDDPLGRDKLSMDEAFRAGAMYAPKWRGIESGEQTQSFIALHACMHVQALTRPFCYEGA